MKGKLPLLFLLIEIVDMAFCEINGSFGYRLNEKGETENPDLSEGKQYVLGQNEVSSTDKNFGKRLSFFGENVRDSHNTAESTEGYSENREFISRMKNNYSDVGSDRNVGERFPDNFNLNNERNKPYGPGLDNSRGIDGIRSDAMLKERQDSFVRYDWERRAQESQTQFDEERRLRQFSNAYPEVRNNNNYARRFPVPLVNNDRRANPNGFNSDPMVSSMQPRYPPPPVVNYNTGIRGGFRDPGFYNGDKGLVINFNTECPPAKNLNNHQMMHKVIFTPKSYMGAHSEGPSFQMPGSAVIASNHMTSPLYYY